MNGKSFTRAFVAFRVTLGGVILLQSVAAIVRVLSGHVAGTLRSHLTIIAVAEALSAGLFLVPKTTRAGGGLLLVIFAIALTIHGIHGELPLFVYAAGVVLVMVEGGSYNTR